MARITLRQLLDHAAEHSYGVPAFNINNMEQALAIMAAASEVDAPVIIQASRGARSYANDVMLKHMMDAVTEIYPHIPVCVHLDHGNEPATCMTAIQAGFTSVMMDGSLKADGKTPGDWDYNVGVTKTVTDMAHLGGISVEGELGVLGLAGNRHGRQGRRPRRRGQALPRPIADQPRRGREVRQGNQGGRACHRHGDFARRLQVLAQARRQGSRHACHRGDPQEAAQHASCHARFLVRAAGTAGHHQHVRRQDESRPGAFRSRRSSAASSTASERSTSIPTTAWP